MELVTFWFILITVLWIGYLVLEGFDFGVGMLLPVVGRNDTERRVLINTIAPVWDGNEVWLIVAGGATFAAFPEWYATLFSGFYLPLLLILAALIIRGVAFEYRGTIESPRWRRTWDNAIVIGSAVPAVLWGVAFANIVAGVPIDADKQFTGTLLTLLNPYGLLGGLTTLLLFAFHGALWLGLRTEGEVRTRSIAIGARLALPTIVVAGGFALWTQFAHGKPWTWALVVIAAVALVTAGYAAVRQNEGLGFGMTTLATVAAVILLFGSLFPDVMPSSTDPAFSLTVDNASSTHYTLVVMTWVAAFMVPVVVLYQSWTYWVFRHRIGVAKIPPGHGLPWSTPKKQEVTS
ncbi:cytochrome d ubiquinol oxidase subunit II [Kineosporia rhizophila]|uniref:cytochrome d ubiquinol oxidase subunit II n=1 Tax=Kineosporia TaxID=49184 RepID=UPI000A5CD2F3|nr:cytochrome d ubiquinol oxidase subunit II [Kineosporia sp. NBRC 101677]MCE0537389.1 cytochrome d ubiquinol oxidase subunit II [Kineosporia rhizophila]GLY17463.1 cytochrome c oxidase assembly protein [Kineosporia sp. NBRC 101677]